MIRAIGLHRPWALTAVALISFILIALVLSSDLPLAVKTLLLWFSIVVVPGILLVEVLVGSSDARPTALEYVLYAIGAGYTLLTVQLLVLSYVPGRLQAWQIVLTYVAFVVIMLLARWRAESAHQDLGTTSTACDAFCDGVSPRDTLPRVIAGLGALLLLAGFLRFTSIGYSEFHGDEARAALRAAAVIQGYDDVLMYHRKAPGEILVPTAVFALMGSLDEASARLPFALANLTALVGVFLLGWRVLGMTAGWAASLLLAMDGYLVGFARFVQYQSIVLLLSILCVLAVYRVYRHPHAVTRYLVLAAVFMAGGLLFHFDMLVAVLPVAFLLIVAVRAKRIPGKVLFRGLLVAGCAGAFILALFYVAYVAHPSFAAIWDYIWRDRLHGAGSPPYNNLQDLFLRTAIYSSTYYILFLAAMTLVALCLAYWRGLRAPIRYVFIGLASCVLLASFWRYDWLTVGTIDLALVPFLLCLVPVLWLPHVPVGERLLWLWFGIPFLVFIFVVATPVTHVYAFFVPWMLLIGAVIQTGWDLLIRRAGMSRAALWSAAAVAVAVAIFGTYSFLLFVYHGREILLEKDDAWPNVYWLPPGVETSYGFYGFPLNNGWKAVGALYDQAAISGDFESNQTQDWIPAWYTRGQRRCNDSAAWFFAVDGPEHWLDPADHVRGRVEQEGYLPWASVELLGQPRMAMYAKEGAPAPPADGLELDAYAAIFDATVTADFPLDYPVVQPQPAHVLKANLDNRIVLEGYDLDAEEPLSPGDAVELALYWRPVAPIEQSLKIFIQAYYDDGKMVVQQDNMPVCNRHPTLNWRPGERIVDRHIIEVADDAPAGTYPLVVGLYSEDTMERLPVLDAAGNPLSTEVWLEDITIED